MVQMMVVSNLQWQVIQLAFTYVLKITANATIAGDVQSGNVVFNLPGGTSYTLTVTNLQRVVQLLQQ
jgi:hypothetical protein